jgi:maltooligosyltrehalose trehalohydrolase
VLDTGAFRWDADAVAVPLEDLVVYELHVGTFTYEGTFDAVVPRLPELAALGVTAIELMPVATFPGERGWGYDGVLTYAPHRAYGGPYGLARLVDAAHANGLAVILDVVYNHVGPGSQLAAFGPYFTDRYETFWGDAIDYSHRGVREWAIQNAELWVRDYRIDGLRLDATHAIFDESEPHIMTELATRVRAVHPGALVIAEAAIGDRRPLDEWGDDAQWADDFHHALHVLLTGEQDGYYEGYGAVADLARAYEGDRRFVVCAQNHDQVGNRAAGDRLPPATRRIAAACVLFAPQIPLLFMGDEYGERAPFQFFTDHDDPAIAAATREGRRREFAKFSAFQGEVPDPQDPATFERSKLHPEAGDDELRAFYADLIALRRSLPPDVDTDADEQGRMLRVKRGNRELVADFANMTVEIR